MRIDKRFQRADWSIRPLSEEMLAYAATDTRHLAELRDILRNRLVELGRLSWAEEEFVVMEGARWDSEDAEPGWLRLKGARLLKPRELAVLRSVYLWRDEQARKLDRAAFRILNNEPILAMAKTPPRDLDALKKIPGIGPDQAERRGRHILAAVEEALATARKSVAPHRATAAPRRRSRPRCAARAAQAGPQPPGRPVSAAAWRAVPQRHAGSDCPGKPDEHCGTRGHPFTAPLAGCRDRRRPARGAARTGQ